MELQDRVLVDLPLTSAVQNGAKPSTFQIDGRDRPELRAFRDEVLRNDPETTALVDVRSPEEFSGEKLAPDHLPQEQPYVGGHVPGAKNIPWSKATREDGTFKSADDLRELYSDVIGGSTVVRLLQDRRALVAHVVRALGVARTHECEELRRFVDRVWISGECTCGARLLKSAAQPTD